MPHQHEHNRGAMCGGLDHHSGEYTPQQQADLDLVLAFNRSVSDAINAGLDVTDTEAATDPDPLRYMWVDEGQGQIAAVIARAQAVLAASPALPVPARNGVTWVAESQQAARPSIAIAPDGTTLTTWIEWMPGKGDVLRAQLSGGSGDAHVVEDVTTEPVDLFRPVTAIDGSGTCWIFVGRRNETSGEVAVCSSQRGVQGWSPLEQISDSGHPSFNQEVAVNTDGSLDLVWQGRSDSRFAIYSRGYGPSGWGETSIVSDGIRHNVWDPAVCALPGGGTAFAWSQYVDGTYQVVLRTRDADGALGRPRILSSGNAAAAYALHPHLATTTDGRLWCAFDEVLVYGHGGSGPTRLRPVSELGDDPDRVIGMRPPGASVPPELIPDMDARIRVVEVLEDEVREAPGELASRLDVVPAGLPKLVGTADGGLAVTYRVHRRLPLMTFYWEVAAQVLGPQGWLSPVTFSGTDGTLEEASVAATRGGVVIAAAMDRRLERALTWTEGFGGRDCPYLYEHHGSIIWHSIHGLGQIVLATLDSAGPVWRPDQDAGRHTPAVAPAAERVEMRRWATRATGRAQAPRRSVHLNGVEHHLYWGDLHRHSLVSRCTSGDEPSLEDFYRYAWDVCDYDFWAVTDHAENSSDYQWWSIQKIADLFHIPGAFVPLYGFEWTSPGSGHQNVIYGDVERGAPIFSAFADDTNTPDGLWRGLAEHPEYPAITIPHHPGAAMVYNDWDYNDPTYSRLVEIFQACRGNYETPGCFRQYSDGTVTGTFTLDGLMRGYRFGFVASSDHGHGASYVGAYAPSLDRAEVFDALHSRRTFAATTRDVSLAVWLRGSDSGEALMGEEAQILGARTVSVHASGYTDLARVEILRDGQVVHVVSPSVTGAGEIAVGMRVEWGEAEGTTVWDGTLRMVDAYGDAARILSTPFWGPAVFAVNDTAVSWRATTRSFGEPYGAQRGDVEVTLVGLPSAVVEVSIGERSVQLTLGEILERLARDGRVDIPGPAGAHGRAGLQPSVGGLTSLGVRELAFDWTDHDLDRAGASDVATFYYVRAYLVDGEMAWSSPNWLT